MLLLPENYYHLVYHKTKSIFINANIENRSAIELINHSKRELSGTFSTKVRFEAACINYEKLYGHRAENDFRNIDEI